jgi:RNA polymerase sigma factor (sigma-70 family)
MGMNFGHWLNRIVANAYKKWKQDQFNHTLSDEFDENAVDPIDERHTQENLIQRISAEISTLKKVDHQEILRLNLIQGFNPREVAEITNIKYWTVVSLIQKFKKKIKEQHA